MLFSSIKDLDVYKRAYELAMHIFEASKAFPKEEKYSLTDQVRRCSRSTCANMREAWSKRRYNAHFVSKMTDADGENSETDTWLDFAHDCGYINDQTYLYLKNECQDVGSMLGAILKHPEKFTLLADRDPKSEVRDPRAKGRDARAEDRDSTAEGHKSRTEDRDPRIEVSDPVSK